jgi:hypothetical protein
MNADTLSLSVAEALLRTQRPKGPRAGHGTAAHPHGVIAVSREAGALGESVARALGDRLGCPVYGREIVERIAEELRQPPEQLRALDERPTFWIEDWLIGMPGTPPQISMDTYMRFLYATVRGMAELGRCVVVGRGAPHLLPPQHTLRVRVIAERADRVRRIQQLRQISERDAARWLDMTDEERTLFVKRNFKVDPNDPHGYDLVLNSSRLSVAECADTIVEAFARAQAHTPQPALS